MEGRKKVEPTKISQEFNGMFIDIQDFTKDKVGAKSLNTRKVFKKIT